VPPQDDAAGPYTPQWDRRAWSAMAAPCPWLGRCRRVSGRAQA